MQPPSRTHGPETVATGGVMGGRGGAGGADGEGGGAEGEGGGDGGSGGEKGAVSYTHLTLPTICSV
eukprot:1336926-Prymnesium_polylepis.1